jgi:hypothetical protein
MAAEAPNHKTAVRDLSVLACIAVPLLLKADLTPPPPCRKTHFVPAASVMLRLICGLDHARAKCMGGAARLSSWLAKETPDFARRCLCERRGQAVERVCFFKRSVTSTLQMPDTRHCSAYD